MKNKIHKKTLIYFLLGALLSFLFLSFIYTLNSVVQLIQIASSIGTIAAAIAAWRSSRAAKESLTLTENQLKEMILQRKISYEPDITISDTNFSVDIDPSKLVTVANWNKIYKDFKIPLINLGLGVAKNVGIKFSINKKFIDYIVSLDEDNRFNFEFKDNVLHFSESRNDNHLINYLDLNEPFNESVGYILPSSNESINSVDIVFPETFIELINCFFYLVDFKDPKKIFPNVKIELTYTDKSANQLNQEIILGFTYFHLTRMDNNEFCLRGLITPNI